MKVFSLSMKFLYNGLLGALMLWGLNILGSLFGVAVEITVFNSLIAGFFGVPGVIFLLAWKMLFV